MWRALPVVCLLASPAAAQVGSFVNPYNPYASSLNPGAVQLRPYVSLDRLHALHQNRSAPASYFAVSGSSLSVLNHQARAAGFRSYPNYPLMGAALSVSRAPTNFTVRSLQPLPFTAAPPVETACDPYLDNDGCLSEYAGWDW